MTFTYYAVGLDGAAPVLDPATGDDAAAVDDARSAATWTPVDTRDPAVPVTSDATPDDHTLALKSLATQKSVIGGRRHRHAGAHARRHPRVHHQRPGLRLLRLAEPRRHRRHLATARRHDPSFVPTLTITEHSGGTSPAAPMSAADLRLRRRRHHRRDQRHLPDRAGTGPARARHQVARRLRAAPAAPAAHPRLHGVQRRADVGHGWSSGRSSRISSVDYPIRRARSLGEPRRHPDQRRRRQRRRAGHGRRHHDDGFERRRHERHQRHRSPPATSPRRSTPSTAAPRCRRRCGSARATPSPIGCAIPAVHRCGCAQHRRLPAAADPRLPPS